MGIAGWFCKINGADTLLAVHSTKGFIGRGRALCASDGLTVI